MAKRFAGVTPSERNDALAVFAELGRKHPPHAVMAKHAAAKHHHKDEAAVDPTVSIIRKRRQARRAKLRLDALGRRGERELVCSPAVPQAFRSNE